MTPTTFRELIDLWPTKAAFATEVGHPYQRAFHWYLRNQIPAEYWHSVLAKAAERGVTLSLIDLVGCQIKGKTAPRPKLRKVKIAVAVPAEPEAV